MRRGPFRHPACPRALLLTALAALLTGGAAAAPAPDTAPDPTTHDLINAGAAALRHSNFPQAAQDFGQAATLDPNLAWTHFGLGLAALGRGDRREFDKAIRRADDLTHGAPEVRYVMGVQRYLARDLHVADEELRGAVRADRYFLEARYALGLIAAARGDLDGARSILKDALVIDEDYSPARFQLGAVLAATGDLDGAVEEMDRALSIDPDLEEALPNRPVQFHDRRVLPGSAHGGGFRLPLPLPGPLLIAPRPRALLAAGSGVHPVPGWFLRYRMALFLEQAGLWSRAVELLELALSSNDREELQTAVGHRLVDYLPHRHLAMDSYRLGDLRDARLHLEIARSRGDAGADDLRQLDALILQGSSGTSIVLQPIPDRATGDTVAIRGLVLTREALSWIEVGEQKALLRPASAKESAELLADGPSDPDVRSLYFEVPAYHLPAPGANLIRIRPATAEGGSGTEVEVLIVKTQPSPQGETPPGAPGGTAQVGGAPSGTP